MYLKFLSLKGFKSFADPVRIQLSPGVTVVVGPNGSGKSNVLDALAWVLGAQGPKQLRSTKMDDVIFAGSAKRGPLGRAEVGLVFDNSDNSLPVPSAEISIARQLFRSGESAYQLNGAPCRLVDLVELLSDAGVGKTQHVIISQGEVDDIVNSKSEERRAVLEEAAGILKYKRRRERSERRVLDAEADLLRVSELQRDLRRKIRPLQKQAEAARNRSEIKARHRALSLWIAQMELSQLRERAQQLRTTKSQIQDRKIDIEQQLELARAELAGLPQEQGLERGAYEALLRRSELAHERALLFLQNANSRIEAISERLSHMVEESELIGAQSALDAVTDRLETLAVEEEALDLQDRALQERKVALDEVELMDAVLVEQEIAELRARLNEARGRLMALRERSAATERDHKANIARVERLSQERLGHVGEIARLKEQELEESKRIGDMIQNTAASKAALSKVEGDLVSVEENYVQARSALTSLDNELRALDALVIETRQGQVREALEGTEGFLGLVIDLLEADEGYEFALEAALGAVGYQGAMVDFEAAYGGFGVLDQQGRSGTIRALFAQSSSNRSTRHLGLDYLMDHVRILCDELHFEAFVRSLLEGVVVGTTKDAPELLQRVGALVVVTKEGRRFTLSELSISSHGSHAAQVRRGRIEARREDARLDLVEAEQARREARSLEVTLRRQLDEATKAQERHERLIERLGEQLGRATMALERCEAELTESMELRRSLSEGEEYAEATEELEVKIEEYLRQIDELSKVASERHSAAMSHQGQLAELDRQSHSLELRRSELKGTVARERADAERLRGMVGDLQAKLEDQRILRQDLSAEMESVQRSRSELETSKVLAEALSSELTSRLSVLYQVDLKTTEKRDALRGQIEVHQSRLGVIAEESASLEIELMGAETRYEATLENHVRYLEASLDEIQGALPVEGVAITQATQALGSLESQLSSIGEVNAFAEAELAELEEQLKFLDAQSEDVRKSRQELRQIVSQIEADMVKVFLETLDDVNGSFRVLFSKLFPGGHGALTLTDESDPMNCGIELDIDLPTKRVRRLSLLSGGERSLVGLAFLFAIFRARPAPFVVLDEVEAALDDRNLTAFVRLIEEFRSQTQLIVITHQKRTMEVADVLVGVSMGDQGVSRLVREDISSYLSQSS